MRNTNLSPENLTSNEEQAKFGDRNGAKSSSLQQGTPPYSHKTARGTRHLHVNDMKQNLGAETGGTSLRKVPATARLLLRPRPAGLNFLVELGEERAEDALRSFGDHVLLVLRLL